MQRFAPMHRDTMRTDKLTPIAFAVFLAGLLPVAWIGIGYLGNHPIGVAMTLVIAACYLAGGLELYRYRRATATLQAAAADTAATQTGLRGWLERLDPSLRNAVRLRVEGERVALPAPALTPYLVGLLVLLGMLGTLLGMMATLRGTGLALEGSGDLQAIRGALASPVKGLAFAFGTSIAGVASSAMLGLLSALCRRERLQVVQALDVEIATTLRPHSQAHQREQAFDLLQQHTALMPVLLDRMQAMMETLERQQLAAGERLASGQADFHTRTEAIHTRLAASVEQSLKDGVAESARAAAAALQPLMESTLAGLARETAGLHERVGHAVQQHLEGVSSGLAETTDTAAAQWRAAAEAQREAAAALPPLMEATLAGLAGEAAGVHARLAEAAQQHLERVSSSLEQATTTAAAQWQAAADAQREANTALAAGLDAGLTRFGETFAGQAEALVGSVSSRLDAGTAAAAQAWREAMAAQQASGEALATRHAQALDAAAQTLHAHATALVDRLQQSHAGLQDTLEARDQTRLAAWTETLDATGTRLAAQWEQAGQAVAERQQAICDALGQTAGQIAEQGQAHARDTIAEISRLVEAASDAPRAAAEVVGELREKLSDSMVRDTAMLEERTRLLGTLETLLDAVNHASTEQRGAVEGLVNTSADLLERLGGRFSEQIEAQAGRLDTAAAQLTGSAVEVASLGEGFGAAVQAFGASNEAMMARLEQIAAALEAAQTRGDEQLAYYVAQAREVIDLSMLSQKQIIGELHQLSGNGAGNA